MDENKENSSQEETLLLRFINMTKEGEYAQIYTEVLSTPRIDDERFEVADECEYYYSVR
jgi:hypothetical protein